MHENDPPNKLLIDAVLSGIKSGVVFLVDSEIPGGDVERLVRKTMKLALEALTKQSGAGVAGNFFVESENPWILRTSFKGWVFFYPIEAMTPETSLVDLGQPEWVFWPNAAGEYARVPWSQWSSLRGKNVWRPSANASTGRRSVWDRLRNP